MSKKTTLVYLDEYKERLREAFGEYSGATESYNPSAEDGQKQKDDLETKKQVVEAILAEPTPSDLVEDEPKAKAEPVIPPAKPAEPVIPPTEPPVEK